MPFTPYHFGLSTLPGLLTRGKLDIAVLIATNVLVDIEVAADNLVAPGWPVHQLWHFHTLLVGGCVGMALGVTAYLIRPFRRGCHSLHSFLGFQYSPTMISMTLSGLIGAWLHVLIDAVYHYDVQPFWPIRGNLLLHWLFGRNWSQINNLPQIIIWICLAGWTLAAFLTTIFIFRKFRPGKNRPSSDKNFYNLFSQKELHKNTPPSQIDLSENQ